MANPKGLYRDEQRGNWGKEFLSLSGEAFNINLPGGWRKINITLTTSVCAKFCGLTPCEERFALFLSLVQEGTFTQEFHLLFQEEKVRLERPACICCFLTAFSSKSSLCQTGTFWGWRILPTFHNNNITMWNFKIKSYQLPPTSI